MHDLLQRKMATMGVATGMVPNFNHGKGACPHCAVWGPQMARKSICFQCDNTGVVAVIQKGSAKEEVVMHLLRALWFFCAHFDILPGAQNCTADQLPRYNMHSFFLANPQADLLPTPLPPELLQIVAVTGPDWTYPTFSQLFIATITKV